MKTSKKKAVQNQILTIFGPYTSMTVDMFLHEFVDYFYSTKLQSIEIKDDLYELLKDKQDYVLDYSKEDDLQIIFKAMELLTVK